MHIQSVGWKKFLLLFIIRVDQKYKIMGGGIDMPTTSPHSNSNNIVKSRARFRTHYLHGVLDLPYQSKK
jgi:hypothetical protein